MLHIGMLRYQMLSDENVLQRRRRRRRRRGRRLMTTAAATFLGLLFTASAGCLPSVRAFERAASSPSLFCGNSLLKRHHHHHPSRTSTISRRDRMFSSWSVVPNKKKRSEIFVTTSAQLERDAATNPNHSTFSAPGDVTPKNRNLSNLYFIDLMDEETHQHHLIKHQKTNRGHRQHGTRQSLVTTRKLWQRRHARTAEEGIRRERTSHSTTSTKLSSLLYQAQQQRDAAAAAAATAAEVTSSLMVGPRQNGSSNGGSSGTYAARTITGLINALAKEVDDLEVHVETRPDTPLWGKQVDAVRIQFSRLEFEPLRMRGLQTPSSITSPSNALASPPLEEQSSNRRSIDDLSINGGAYTSPLTVPTSASTAVDSLSIDEAFARMDSDNSGTLDTGEIAQVLNHVAASQDSLAKDDKLMEDLASQLIELYDANGDGVVDRYEYQSMVEDMAAVRRAQQERLSERKKKNNAFWLFDPAAIWQFLRNSILGKFIPGFSSFNAMATTTAITTTTTDEDGEKVKIHSAVINDAGINQVNVTAAHHDSVAKTLGSITFSDLKLDLRRLVFGAVPILKHITPGGPLVLEPFTTTVAASFTREDVMESRLLDEGLRRLIGRALRRRVRNFRDLVDGAVFFGRTWKMSSRNAPMVEVSRLTDVEFDPENRLIVTGRVRIRHSPDAPIIENAFKVRTQLGTRKHGQVIRLVDPELALVLECPKSCERSLGAFWKSLGQPTTKRPEPLYFFFPMYSPFRVEDQDGFDLGEDNSIKSIGIQDGALQFEMSAVVRPGRFLGNHYLALTIPKRTFILTMDRVREGIRSARQAKRERVKLLKQSREQTSDGIEVPIEDEEEDDEWGWVDTWTNSSEAGHAKVKAPKSFFSRFVEGYAEAGGKESQASKDGLSVAISEWFGRQQSEDIDSNLKP